MSVNGCYFAGERKRREQDTMRERGGEGKGREGRGERQCIIEASVPRFGMRSRVCECPRRKCTRESGIVCLYFPLHPLEREGVALISTLRYLTTSKPSTVNCAALQLF